MCLNELIPGSRSSLGTFCDIRRKVPPPSIVGGGGGRGGEGQAAEAVWQQLSPPLGAADTHCQDAL